MYIDAMMAYKNLNEKLKYMKTTAGNAPAHWATLDALRVATDILTAMLGNDFKAYGVAAEFVKKINAEMFGPTAPYCAEELSKITTQSPYGPDTSMYSYLPPKNAEEVALAKMKIHSYDASHKHWPDVKFTSSSKF